MCCHQDISTPKEDYGISISSPWYGPPTLVCWQCSLSSEEFWVDKSDQWSHLKRVTDHNGVEYNHHAGCFCCAGHDYRTMARHVIEHILNGEDIHPSVLKTLDHFYIDYRGRQEYLVSSHIGSTLARKMFGDNYWKHPEYSAIVEEACTLHLHEKYEPSPRDPRDEAKWKEENNE